MNTLNISGINFGQIFKKKLLLNSNTFPKLSHLTLEIISTNDYYYITKILECSKLTLIELNLSANFDFDKKKKKMSMKIVKTQVMMIITIVLTKTMMMMMTTMMMIIMIITITIK